MIDTTSKTFHDGIFETAIIIKDNNNRISSECKYFPRHIDITVLLSQSFFCKIYFLLKNESNLKYTKNFSKIVQNETKLI